MLKTILKILKNLKLKCSSSCCKSKCAVNVNEPYKQINK